MKDFYNKRIDVLLQLSGIASLIVVALTAFVYSSIGQFTNLSLFDQCIVVISAIINFGLFYLIFSLIFEIFNLLEKLKNL